MELDSNSVVFEAVRRRRRALRTLVIFDLALVACLACIRVTATEAGGSGALGFHVTFEALHWRSLITAAGILLVQLWLGGHAVRQALLADEVMQIYPDLPAGQETAHGIHLGDLVGTVLDVAKASGISRISRIFLVPTPIPNAFTAQILGMGNVVALHANLFAFLSPGGLRAVIAHEVAHIRRGDSLVRQITTAPGMMAATVFSILLLQILAGIFSSHGFVVLVQRLVFLAIALGATAFTMGILRQLATTAARDAEHIADAHAARICGWEDTANMLLLLGERTEALQALAETYGELIQREGDEMRVPTEVETQRLLRRFPPGELSEDVAREAAPRLLVQDRLEVLRDHYLVPLDEGQIEALAEAAASAMAAESAARAVAPAEGGDGDAGAAPDPQEEPLSDWRQFDFDSSGHLDAEELAELVRTLRDEPQRMLFRQFLSPESKREDHPPVRDRILFLADVHKGSETSPAG